MENSLEISYTSQDKSIEVRLVYIVKRRLRFYKGIGKSWPKHTQCLAFVNGLIVGYGEVIKHENDADNPNFAYKEATKKVMGKINIKSIRQELWKILHSVLKARTDEGFRF